MGTPIYSTLNKTQLSEEDIWKYIPDARGVEHKVSNYVEFGGRKASQGRVPNSYLVELPDRRHIWVNGLDYHYDNKGWRNLGHGLKRNEKISIWEEVAFGYISGYPISAIIYYIAVRRLYPKWLRVRFRIGNVLIAVKIGSLLAVGKIKED